MFRTLIPYAMMLALLSGCETFPETEPADAPQSSHLRAEAIFEEIENDPNLLQLVLRELPKGGDLHNHLGGTPFAEEFLNWAGEDGYCINVDALGVSPPPCADSAERPAAGMMRDDPTLYAVLVDAMSVRGLLTGSNTDQSGHTQFFDSFDRFIPIYKARVGSALASSRRIAARDTVLYQELMYNPAAISQFTVSGPALEWSGDLQSAFDVIAPALPDMVRAARADTDQVWQDAETEMGCTTESAHAGCGVAIAHNCYGLRLMTPDALFRQLAGCFALIEADPRFVGMSLVQPEDDPLAVTGYDLHMEMVAFLNRKFPAARVSLHAGELTASIVPSDALKGHIAKAINVAGSERIGHGVAIALEDNARETLSQMAREEIAVEINLTSNDVILGVTGADHPLNLYRRVGVPIVLSTDDLGVLRSDMTEQYVRAVREHGLTYGDLKKASRNSLHFSFLPGESLWMSADYEMRVPECADTSACDAFAASSPKAALQLLLERKFEIYEADLIEWHATLQGE